MRDGGYKGCCSCPHGKALASVSIILALASWGLSIAVHATCFFVRASGGDSEIQNTGFGMWTRENVGLVQQYQCQEYTWQESAQFDTVWTAATGLAYAAGTFGFISSVLLIGITSTHMSHPSFFRLLAANFYVAGILDFCTLIAATSSICYQFTVDALLSDNVKCEYSTGAWLAIAAGVCYFITATLVLFIPPGRKEDSLDSSAAGDADAAVPLTKNDYVEDDHYEDEAAAEDANKDSEAEIPLGTS